METGKLGLPKRSTTTHPTLPTECITNYIVQFIKAAESTGIGREIMARLGEDERVKKLADTLVRCGNSASRFGIEDLAAWWLWRANEVDIEKANQDLEDFLDSDSIDILSAIWVFGIETDNIQNLTDEIRLIPAVQMPDSWDKDYVCSKRFSRPILGMEILPRAALVKRHKSVKICSAEELELDSAMSAISVTDDEALRQLRDIALLLNCLPDVFCTPVYSTSYCPPEVPLGPFGGSGGGTTVFDLLPRRTSKLDSGQESLVAKLSEKFAKLDQSSRRRFERALLRLAQAKGRSNRSDKALDVGIALEMLLLSAEHNKQELPDQLSLHFRLRGAWLIGESTTKRQAVYKTLRRIYTWRSQVAHNGYSNELEASGSEAASKIEKEMGEAITIAERIFQTLVLEGTPDWQQLILGE